MAAMQDWFNAFKSQIMNKFNSNEGLEELYARLWKEILDASHSLSSTNKDLATRVLWLEASNDDH